MSTCKRSACVVKRTKQVITEYSMGSYLFSKPYIRVENIEMDIHSITIGNLWMVEIRGIKNVYAHFRIYLQ